MSHTSKVQSQGKVPFAWENKPGVSKVIQQECPTNVGHFTIKLPPPPCPPDRKARVYAHDLQMRSLSKRGLRKHDGDDDDPFFIAYKECTKSTGVKSKVVAGHVKSRKNMLFNFSCKDSSSVRDGNLVKISQFHSSFSE